MYEVEIPTETVQTGDSGKRIRAWRKTQGKVSPYIVINACMWLYVSLVDPKFQNRGGGGRKFGDCFDAPSNFTYNLTC